MTSYEHTAREQKVERLVAFLEEHGQGLALAETIGSVMHPSTLREIEKMAGLPCRRKAAHCQAGRCDHERASETTWQAVRSELRHRERVAARKAERMVAA